ncbi:recombinase family protein [Streptomyces sp. NPDC002285]
MATALISPNVPTSVALAQLTVSYGRVSLDEQKVGKGVASQHSENEEFGEEIGHPVTARYEDIGISAFSGKERPGFRALLRDIQAGLIAIVIVWHADRLTRDTSEADEFIKLCIDRGVTVWSQQRGGAYNFKRAAGRADFKRDIVKAEEESAHKGERVSLSHKRRALNGEWGGGVRPYGWGVDTGRVRSKCVNPRADVSERVYEDVPVLDMTQHRTNERDEIRSWAKDLLANVKMNQVVRSLNMRKVPTVSQADGRKIMRKGKNILTGKWSRETVIGILANPRVAGHAVWRGQVVKWNAFDPIITEEERQALITLFADPSRKTSPGNTPKWLGSLIYECAVCDDGSTLTVGANNKGEPAYRCGNCTRGKQLAVPLDQHVETLVIERLSRGDVTELIPATPEIDLAELQKESKELAQRKEAAGVSFGRGKISLAVLESATAEIDKRLGEIRALTTAAVAEHPLAPFLGADDASAVWEGLTLGRRREVLKALGRITVEPRKHPGAARVRPLLDTSAVVFTVKRPTPVQGEQELAA